MNNVASPTPTAVPQSGNGETPLLRVYGLTTQFRTPRGTVHAVDDVSFRIRRGDTLGIVGESGSGKSVLARTIMRLLPRYASTEGDIQFEGRDLRAMSDEEARKIWGSEISMVFQDPATALNPVMRVGAQITEALELHLGLEHQAARARAIELLNQVGIPEPERRMRNHPHELSGGMLQRVWIAIAIACSPKLLFADEPTTALDVTIQRQVLDLLTSLQRQNEMSMVLITHDLGVLARRASVILVMYGGQVVEAGLTTALFRETRHPYTSSLLASTPRLEHASHTRLAAILGRPVDVIDPKPGCRFAPRCRHAQPRCLTEDPVLMQGPKPGHRYRCFYPVGTPEGEGALEENLTKGQTAAGVKVRPRDGERI
jgi:peptide/nickel transport system ATP-binding protein